jgi:carbonic anhydrase
MKKPLLLASVIVASTTLAIRGRPSGPAAAGDSPGALERLRAGNERFVQGEPSRLHQSMERRSEVAREQKPFAVIVGCADSRVPPELVFDQGLGDLFVVRCAGNVLGEAAIGSIEYAVEHLGCELVIVLAHERCGAVEAVVEGDELPGHLASFAPSIEPAVAEARHRGGDLLDQTVRANAVRVADQLLHCPPILAERVDDHELAVIAARYDLDTGEVEWLDAATRPIEH